MSEYSVIYKEEKLVLYHGDKGWHTRKPFTIIEKKWQPSPEHKIYDSEVITTIIDKKGNIVPILRLKPHKHIEKCESRCPCGEIIMHDPEIQEKITDTGHLRISICKRCKKVTKTETPHELVMTEPEIIKCIFCSYTKKVPLTPENIREYAVPPFPLKPVLKAWNLTLEEILQLDKVIKEEIIPTKPKRPAPTYSLEFRKFIRKITEGVEIDDELWERILQRIPEIKEVKYRNIPIPFWFKTYTFYLAINNKTLKLFLFEGVPIDSKDILPSRYERVYLYTRQFKSDEEAFHSLGLPSPEEVQKEYQEYCAKFEKYEKEYEAWLKKVKEKVENTETYKKLYKFLVSSKYGRKIAYAVDPYNGIIATRPHEITEDFFTGVKELNLL